MPNILDFLTRNPEQAFQMLQAFGAMQEGSGSTGFRGILGRELQGLGAIGAAPYELKRQKEEEEYQKKQRKLQEKREALEYRTNQQTEKMNQLSLQDKEADKRRKYGKTVFNSVLASAVKEYLAQDKFKGKSSDEIPDFNPEIIQMPAILTKASPEEQEGWQMGYQDAFATYTANDIAKREQLRRESETATNKLEREIQSNRQDLELRRYNLMEDRAEMERLRKEQHEYATLAQHAFDQKKGPEIETQYRVIQAGHEQRNYAVMGKGLERFINPGNMVTLKELAGMFESAMPPITQAEVAAMNWMKSGGEIPVQMNQEGADYLKRIADGIYDKHAQDINTTIGELSTSFSGRATKMGLSLPQPELYEYARPWRLTAREGISGPTQDPETQEDMNKLDGTMGTPADTSIFNQNSSPADSSKGGFFGGDTLDALHGGIGDSSVLEFLGLGALGAGGYKLAKKKWSGKPPVVGETIGSGSTVPGPGPLTQSGLDFGGQNYAPNSSGIDASNYFGQAQADPLDFTKYAMNSPGIEINKYNMSNPAGTVKSTNLGGNMPPPKPGLNPVGSSYKFPNSVPWRLSAPATRVFDPKLDYFDQGPAIPFDNPDTPPSGYNANSYGKMAQESAGHQFRVAQGGNAEELTPSRLKRLMKNPALAKALGYFDTFDKTVGGFAGGLVDTGFLTNARIQDLVRQGMYGRGASM